MFTSYHPVILNLLYAFAGGVLTLIFMWVGWNMLGRLTSIRISQELKNGNTAVGMMVMGIFIGVGVAMGLVVGLALN
jgi:uncharacterized membrane protein YjfL (UPF0719 family)